jgi:hypothetical protein
VQKSIFREQKNFWTPKNKISSDHNPVKPSAFNSLSVLFRIFLAFYFSVPPRNRPIALRDREQAIDDKQN